MFFRKEIGSEFWNTPTKDISNHFFDNASWFISGRAAFRSILQDIKSKHPQTAFKVALPSYLCESMILPLEKEDIEYKFYKVDFCKGTIKYDYSSVNDCNIVVLIDYFGYESKISYPLKNNSIIIRDLTHSIFIRRYDDADYYFGSLRKWASFAEAGYAFKNEKNIFPSENAVDSYYKLRTQAFQAKKKYINGEIDNKEYLEIFDKAETMLEECSIASSHKEDIDKANHLDVEFIKTKRRENAQILINKLKDCCIYQTLGDNDCPLFVPIIYNKRDELRKYLISKEIYCPIHWPKPSQVPDDLSPTLYNQELSIICDQRYSEQDMILIAEEVLRFMEAKKHA